MPSPFEVTLYLRGLQARWKRIVAVTALAAAVALVVSLLLPKQYDATVTLVIQPAGSDPRYPAVMSQVYLEYLRSYEQFLQSDGLLARLFREFKLDQRPYDYTAQSFRRSALQVTLAKNTTMLKVRVRLPDPDKAHEVALGLARLATERNAEINSAAVDRAGRQVAKEMEGARGRLAAAQSELEKFRRQSRGEELARQVEKQLERKVQHQGELSELQINLAEKEARLASLSASVGSIRTGLGQGPDTAGRQLRDQVDLAAAEVQGLRARLKALRAALAELEAPLARNQATLASLDLRRQELERNFELAQTAVAVYADRANDARLNVAARREELQIADTGAVPSRPSSPRPLLNVTLAAFLGLLGSLLFETWAWNWSQEQRALDAMMGGSPQPTGGRMGRP